MNKNVGPIDKILRILLAGVIAILYFTNVITGTFGIILLIFAGILAITSLIGFCGLYTILGINTCKFKSKGN